jgi:hypothetical protein
MYRINFVVYSKDGHDKIYGMWDNGCCCNCHLYEFNKLLSKVMMGFGDT